MNCLSKYLDMESDYNVVCKLHSLGMNDPHGLELAGYNIECKSLPLPRRWRCTLIVYTTATSHHLLRIQQKNRNDLHLEKKIVLQDSLLPIRNDAILMLYRSIIQ